MTKTEPISEVYNIDCLDYMQSLPDNYFDLVIADPPYGDAKKGNGSKRYGGTNNWSDKYDSCKGTKIHTQGGTWASKRGKEVQWDVAPTQQIFDEIFRVSKNQIIWGGNYFELPPTRGFAIWRKTNVPENFTLAMAEYAWTSFDMNAKVFDYTAIRKKTSGNFHPTEKPIALYQWLLKWYAKEGDKIYDPFMGSQTSRIASYLGGFDYYGTELSKSYFDKGNEYFNRMCNNKEELNLK